ncbi:hypothetical protein MesoLj131c_49570 [Mesorhizobium sp. 131-3-5]|uniref:antibiotic biosynthesis monooxygenase family protein n=1 Tax=Mesorhizobium sp. 131-3-5 TaxID=2744520 RepID=UPI001936C367|nr:antibiotic biosynthesis monooxygenase family protein [Mesorhizobium sp. 131-3-5]BCH10699.1 hypothetical protein MesoLj131c_49570 [Mesorhizobium sp. 131-3-5]
MPIIRADTGVISQINVFTVPEGGQQALIDLLRETAMSCRGIPGWMSASLHRSLDGTRVVNYAQARDQAAMQRVFEHLRRTVFSTATGPWVRLIPASTRSLSPWSRRSGGSYLGPCQGKICSIPEQFQEKCEAVFRPELLQNKS